MNIYEIPLTSEPTQNFRCNIPIDGKNKELIFDINYNIEALYWIMKITDSLTGKVLIDSIPLIQASNILEQYSYLEIGSCYIIKVNPDIEGLNPDETNLGTGFKMYWSDTM